MGQTLIGLLRKSDAKVTFLVSEASKSQILCACGGHNWYCSNIDRSITKIWCKSNLFSVWGLKVSNLGCLVSSCLWYAPAAGKIRNLYTSKIDWFITQIWCKSDPFSAWGLKVSNCGCLVVSSSWCLSYAPAAGKIRNLYISKTDWFITKIWYKSDHFSAWGLKVSNFVRLRRAWFTLFNIYIYIYIYYVLR